ncbi:sulfotransferase family protein [Pseudoalteromonas sp. SSDWG2]|uniref:sulfotransferase family protein n=1 Tax=Pseudoalteromonas sp. SSDWG2 TaxID=3139391 RepID=UPI003BAAF02E
MSALEKIFVIGLPRTGTTSVCVAALEGGYKTAHTAYTQACFEQAQFIADTPCFSHYHYLAKRYPKSKFVLLRRDEQAWLGSITRLLARMHKNLLCEQGGFSPLLKQSYQRVFAPLNEHSIADEAHLLMCYQRHYDEVMALFSDQPQRLLAIDVSCAEDYHRFCEFLGIENSGQGFAHLNKGNKVMAWKDVQHPLKVQSTRNGKVDNLDSWWQN